MSESSESAVVGQILGTDDATPMEFWVGIAENAYLQLGDVVQVRTEVPDVGTVRISGVVEQVRARQEGARFERDTFRASEGVMPLEQTQAAKVNTTRVEPEYWVPPRPGQTVYRARGASREEALFFDEIDDGDKLLAGQSRDGEPMYIDRAFLDGRKGAHVNISGVSGVATKTTYASFLLYSLFDSGALGRAQANTKSIVFNVKGEDLLFLDKPNAELSPEEKERYREMGLEPGPFDSVGLWAPAAKSSSGGAVVPDTGQRQSGVQPYFWTVRELIAEDLLKYMFVEAGDERSQIADLVSRVSSRLQDSARPDPSDPGAVTMDGTTLASFDDLCTEIEQRLETDQSWQGRMSHNTISAFIRRLRSAQHHLGHLVRGPNPPSPEDYQISWDEHQLSVIDIHSLPSRAQRFVVGSTIRDLLDEKEQKGTAEPLVFLVLDELNKYAPAQGWSPIKETLLDIAERGRSLGIILIGAQQTASEVERRVVSNSAIRVVGRLDAAEAARREYGWLTDTARDRSKLLKPGHMLLQQPNLPLPLELTFPFPSWATRAAEVEKDGKGENAFGAIGV